MAQPSFEDPGALRAWHSPGSGQLRIDLERSTLEIAVGRDGCLRLRAAAGPSLPPDPSAAVGRTPWAPAAAEPQLREGGLLALAFDGPDGSAELEVEAAPFLIRLRARDGGRVAEISGLGFAPDGRSRVSLRAEPEEGFFGFGEKAGGLDKRGELLRMRNHDADLRLEQDPLYVSIPFFLGLSRQDGSPRARGVLLDAFAPSSFDVARGDASQVVMQTEAGGIDLTVFPGPEPRDVLRRFTARVGRTPLPPLWALGHHQSRWSYANEKEVRAVARAIRERGMPTDVIHLDIDYMEGFRVFTWNRRRFPDPARLLRDLASQGFRVVTIIDPGVKVDDEYPTFQEGMQYGHFCRKADGTLYTLRVWPGKAALPDFNLPATREWWGECHRPLLEAGVAGIWNDMNEPAGWTHDLRLGRVILPIKGQDLGDVVQADPVDSKRTVPHEEVRNLYGQQHARSTREFLERAEPDRRHFVLSRSGFAGIQRHAAIWTGDNTSTWSQLRLSLPMLMNLSLSGVPFCGADIGGFAFSCTPELYARWIQIGALYPFARTHSMWLGRRQEPWRFGGRVETIARQALELRMRLLPYLAAQFREAEETGAPVWRALLYEFPGDPQCAQVEDQVLVGPALLAAPVLQRGARERTVYLPRGVWYGWHDGARHIGPRTLTVPAPLERMPLFVRGDAIVHTRSPVRHAQEAPEEPVVLEIFPGEEHESSVEIVEDDGESTAYRHGVVATTRVRVRPRAGGRLRVEISARQGGYTPPPRNLRLVVHGCPVPRSVRLDASEIAAGEGFPGYTFAEGRVQIRLPGDPDAHSVEVEPAP